jgi:hypothetical protein
MGVGLKEIGAGLVDAVALKADMHGRSIPDQLRHEQSEFAAVRSVVRSTIQTLPCTEDREDLEAFEAMLILGEHFLELRHGPKSADLSLEVDARVETFIAFLRRFDEAWKNEYLDRPLTERAAHAVTACMGRKNKEAA